MIDPAHIASTTIEHGALLWRSDDTVRWHRPLSPPLGQVQRPMLHDWSNDYDDLHVHDGAQAQPSPHAQPGRRLAFGV